ncbi:MAG: hypothetical protein CMM44_06800 [Rhodospirillaceae bacterium]|nr:hypothetical protein [Rhodospirillaceae bacterium]
MHSGFMTNYAVDTSIKIQDLGIYRKYRKLDKTEETMDKIHTQIFLTTKERPPEGSDLHHYGGSSK